MFLNPIFLKNLFDKSEHILFYFLENNEKLWATLHIVTEKRTSFCWLLDSRVVNRVFA